MNSRENYFNWSRIFMIGGGQSVLRVYVCAALFTFHFSFFTAFAQSSERTYDHFFLEAMMQRQKGNNDAAFDLLRHCVELSRGC